MGQDFELFVSLAEIAGIFVAFGALISLTRRSETAPIQEALLRFVVAIGLVVVVAALVPIALHRYGIASDFLWAATSAVFLLLIWSGLLTGIRTPDIRPAWITDARATPALRCSSGAFSRSRFRCPW